ncbi:MAG: ATP-binding protein [Desulfovibrio sp.]|nr:ATP-binding protein [Desulfovibrio sp.]
MKLFLKALRRRRTYNSLVTNEAIEDFSLRHVNKSFRRWSEWELANTALGGISFLALEAIGALIILNYGFINSALAVTVLSVIIILTGIPISYYASKENIDIDLLTRGAGFGYIGSTITSLIYAFFTIIFFALEATIMAKALNLCFGLPLSVGYFVCSVIIIPFSFYGVTVITKLQNYTQYIWLVMWIGPLVYIIVKDPGALKHWVSFGGMSGAADSFSPLLFGSALSVVFSLVPQIGEQVDYLRFLPDKTRENRVRWWLAVLAAGPGWIVVGATKIMCGSFLAVLLLRAGGAIEGMLMDPVDLYLNAYELLLQNKELAVIAVTIYVVICQVKINVTNAYAGSLAWSNFFSRVTRSHPGRAVWLVFNVVISMLLMQLGIFKTLHGMLQVYSIFAVAWVAAIASDLTILKPLGISPGYVEYKRAYLHSINPVGFGAMCLASLLALCAYFGMFGEYLASFPALLAFLISFATAPVIAVLTRGKYYLKRENHDQLNVRSFTCSTCHKQYESKDMIYCPVYDEHICSLCCSLDSICEGRCKVFSNSIDAEAALTEGSFTQKTKHFIHHYTAVMTIIALIFFITFAATGLSEGPNWPRFRNALIVTFTFTALVVGVWIWWFTLIQERRLVAEDELDKQIHELRQEARIRKKVSAVLEKTSKQQQLILENATIGIAYIIGSELIWCNNRFLDLCLVPRNMTKPVSLYRFFPDPQLYARVDEESRQNIRRTGNYFEEFPLARGSGAPCWRTLSINAIDPEDFTQGMIWLINDITQQKVAEQELKESRRRLKDLNENLEAQVRKRTRELKQSYRSLRQADKMASLGILIAGMAHEINNPMNFIRLNSQTMREVWLGIMELLEQQSDPDENIMIGNMPLPYAQKNIPRMLDGIVEGCDRVSNIVRNLKDYSRQSPVNMGGQVDINEALRAALTLLAPSLTRSTDHFQVETSDTLPIFKGDMRRIEQVLINLIQNACQALEDKSKSIHVKTYTHGPNVCFRIMDQGVGIPARDLSHVRDPFFTTKRSSGGTGLGLSVSAGIVDEHEGTMEIESVLGEGTTVTLTFPCTP